jgi:hypothetical protein
MIEHADPDPRPWWLRLRSACGLAVLVIALGVSAAALLGLSALALASLLDHSLG